MQGEKSTDCLEIPPPNSNTLVEGVGKRNFKPRGFEFTLYQARKRRGSPRRVGRVLAAVPGLGLDAHLKRTWAMRGSPDFGLIVPSGRDLA